MTEDSAVPKYSAKWWHAELQRAEKVLDDDWRRSAKKIVARYLDDRREDMVGTDQKKYNIFWANTQIMKSALYATPPSPEVRRQHNDTNDDVARTAALIQQRILTFSLNADDSEEHKAFQMGVEDRLVPGLGQVWVRYEAETEEYEIPAVGNEPPRTAERIVKEEALIEYVQWQDFVWSPARIWKEVWWVSRGVWMSEEECQERFGKQKAAVLKENVRNSSAEEGFMKGFTKGKYYIREIWCKSTKKAYWVHCESDTTLDERKDPLKLKSFFPCPPPLRATHTTNSTLPRPDYVLVQDQYDELDVLNHRISVLTRALRVVGLYDSGVPELQSLLTGSEMRMIPVEDWQAFSEKKGVEGTTTWFPLDVLAKVLEYLINQRVAVIQQIYELTSISDIMRGVSNARETAKAQTLKAQYSSVRLQLTQQDVSAWVTSALRLKVEIICKHFQPQSIYEQSQIAQTDSAIHAEQAIQLIKDYNAQQFRIIIAEESLSLADYNAERESRTEFLTSIGQFLSQAGQITESQPQALPYLLKMIAWVAASFRGADDIETVLDQAVEQASQPPPEPEEPPDPSIQINQEKLAFEDKKLQTETSLKERELAMKEREMQQASQMKVQDDEMNRQHETQLRTLEMSFGQAQQQAKEESAARQQQTQQFAQIMQAMIQAIGQMTEKQEQVAMAQIQASQQTTEVISNLLGTISKRRRRVPVRDQEGTLLYADEEFIEE